MTVNTEVNEAFEAQSPALSESAALLLAYIPWDQSIGSASLKKMLSDDFPFDAAKTELLEAGFITIGRGRGGSIRRR